MTGDMKGLLLDDRWAPVTSEMGFLETDAEHAARTFATWWGGLLARRGIAVGVQPVPGPLEQALHVLGHSVEPRPSGHDQEDDLRIWIVGSGARLVAGATA